MGEHKFRAGDVVFVPALAEEWLLACDESNGYVTCCGWPEAQIETSKVELREAASDAVRLGTLREVAKSGSGPRAGLARRQLAAEPPRLYAERDIQNPPVRDHYMHHLGAMTTEDLRDKADIAAELAWRDAQIAELEAKLARETEGYNQLFDSIADDTAEKQLVEAKARIAELEAERAQVTQLGFLAIGERFCFVDRAKRPHGVWVVTFLDQSGSASGGPECTREGDGAREGFWMGEKVFRVAATPDLKPLRELVEKWRRNTLLHHLSRCADELTHALDALEAGR